MRNRNVDAPRLLTVREAARTLRIGRTKLYELFDTGELGSVMIGDRRLVPERELADFVERSGR